MKILKLLPLLSFVVAAYAAGPTLTQTISPGTGIAPLAITLSASCSSSDPCVSYVWSFGDGTSATGATQTHTFQSAGSYDVLVVAIDKQAQQAHADRMIVATGTNSADNIDCALGNVWIGGSGDGPASLPTRCLNTSIANTPSTGTTATVKAGLSTNLQTAYNAAGCGQTILVPAGSVWSNSVAYKFASKSCDDQHWITIKTTGTLPAEGVRVGPSNAPQMFRINISGSAALTVGDHVRFVGMELGKIAGSPPVVAFVSVSDATKVVFDRVYIHGNPGEESRRGITITNSSTYIGIVDSYIAEMHCVAITGTCVDSQAISGGTGTNVPASGGWAIKDNFLEAASENILFGGAVGDGCPSDIEIRRNHFYKPMSWNPLDPTYIGTAYVVKNLFELKTGCRILFEGNILENTWAGFSQYGWAILLTPKNQTGGLCPLCQVTDVTMRYNYVDHAAGGLSISNGAADDNGWSAGGGRDSIHDIVFDGMQYATCYGGCATNLNELASAYAAAYPPSSTEILHDVTLDHITLITNKLLATAQQESATAELAGPPKVNSSNTPQIANFKVTNWLVATGTYGTYPTGGGADNCSIVKGTIKPKDEIAACWTGVSMFTGSTLVGYPLASTDWPTGNYFAADWPSVGLVNYNNGDGGDYHLAASSVFKGTALDGKDPGADVDAVNKAITGVRSPQ